MPWYMIFIVLALVFYSWAVWGAYAEHELCWLFVWLFISGFVMDLIGTAPMIAKTNGFSVHATLGVAALIIMGLHATWAWMSLARSAANRLFHQWSPWAYCLWVITLTTGGILHMMGK